MWIIIGATVMGVWLQGSKSVTANTSSDVAQVINSPEREKIESWLIEVEKKFPTNQTNKDLLMAITDAENLIQELDSPAREKGMELIDKQYAEINTDIQELQNRFNTLTRDEKNILNELLFKNSQKHFAELLLFLSKNSPKEITQCKKPKIII